MQRPPSPRWNGAAMNGAAPPSPELPDWKEFCELHARLCLGPQTSSARRGENPSYDCPGAGASFSQHFTTHFLDCFTSELSRAHAPGSPGLAKYSIVPFVGIQSCPLPYGRDLYLRRREAGASSESLDSMDSGQRQPHQGPQAPTAHPHKVSAFGQSRSSEDVSDGGLPKAKFKKGFSLRNMSLCVVDGVREIWHRRASPEPEQGRRANGESGERWSQRLRMSKASQSPRAELLEIQREGTLRYMVADDTSSVGSSQWQKCRLLLRKAVRVEGERFLLEFYVPPKSTKPKVSVPLSAIVEVRTTMPLEMPDKDNTFVLKVENGAEYILETIDSLQKHSWVADIQDCIDPGDSGDDIELASCPHGPDLPSRDFPIVSSYSCELLAEGVHRVPERPCPTTTHEPHSAPSVRCREVPAMEHPAHIPLERFLQTLETPSPGQTPGQPPSQPPTGVPGEGGEPEGEVCLTDYPWFHGTLSRVRAAQLVLAGGPRSHGLFVIRQSETRPGEYVLTFNFQGKAKHLRLSVNESGQCHVHHLWFQTVSDMLRHFHTHPIPLESGGSADITLRSYVQAQRPLPDPGSPPLLTPPSQPGCRNEAHQSQHYFSGAFQPIAPPSEGPVSSPSSSPSSMPPFPRGEGPGLPSRSNSSERLLEPPSVGSEDYHESDGSRRARAVENQYSFY
ncbi:SH2B adapter protein 2-like [Huso huso]|uniref:SH2B adapter protein 2-like n=1 Tax=Huso huso TaxID=61971 RepID=A0ABR0YSF9_HUSHU